MPGYELARAAFPKVRQSLLSNFDSCELASFFDHTFGDYHTHPQGRGSIFHRTAAECLRLMVQNDERTIDVDTAYGVLEEQLRQHDAADDGNGRLPVPMDQIAELRITVKKWALDNSFTIENIVSVEDRYETAVPYIDPATSEVVQRVLTGQPDVLLIDPAGDATVIDWKDTWALPGESSISEGGFFQQRFYAMLVFTAYKAVQTVTLREFYPRFSEARTATIGREDLPELQSEFSALVERFDAAWTAHILSQDTMDDVTDDDAAPLEQLPLAPAEFNPSPGSHCSYCKMPERCGILPDARGSGSVTSLEQAEVAAAQHLVAKAVVKKTGDALRNWTREHGPVPVKDAKKPRLMGYQPTTRKTKPTQEQLMAALAAADTDDDREAIISSLFKTTTGTKFGDYVPETTTETT